ncbi:MAG: 16S rRNA (uracil(1498)-N(3))-methyltransferase [Gemmataceae bacterium]|nr:16S rRNA (uracil(1498)-N(3))-methyltransferase [Gemmata sp.]MDW8199124.1 16S rRNA (uracil(1498)-N(3))-methyltransferase [Gemmataceae bacterium]
MSERFFTPEPLSPGEFQLTGAEAHHLAAVCRYRPGDRIVLFNGDNSEYPADVVAVGKRSVTLRILSREWADRELKYPLIVGCALPKGDRADFLIEKLTELGVTQFVPLITARSIVQPKSTVVEKFARMVVEASKQCGRNRLMVIAAPQRWESFIRNPDLPAQRFVLHPRTDATTLPPAAQAVAVAIGPEGGLTEEEVTSAVAAQWQVAHLGPRILRIETAAVAAAAVLGQPPLHGTK